MMEISEKCRFSSFFIRLRVVLIDLGQSNETKFTLPYPKS